VEGEVGIDGRLLQASGVWGDSRTGEEFGGHRHADFFQGLDWCWKGGDRRGGVFWRGGGGGVEDQGLGGRRRGWV